MTACRRRGAWLAAALALHGQALLAQTDIDASVSLRSEAWSGDRLLDDRGGLVAASAWGAVKLGLGEAGQVVGRGWLRAASRDDGAPGGRVRELYWVREFGPVSFRFGRQMLVWGRADGLNPTDNLAPRDFTLLTSDDGEQRHGNLALGAGLPAGPGVLALAWFPHAASHTIALPALPQGVQAVVDGAPRDAQWAVKWDASLGAVDASVSCFDGIDPMPDLNIVAASAVGVEVALRNHRARVLGADFSMARDGVVWRAEAAWLRTDSRGRDDFVHKKAQLWVVAGGEWSPGRDTTLGLQLTARQVFDFAGADSLADPVAREVAVRQLALAGQTARQQFGVLWRLAQRRLDDRLDLELSGVALAPRSNGLLRARLDYALSDELHLRGGVVASFGADDTSFGQLRRNNLVYLQLRLGLSAARGWGR